LDLRSALGKAKKDDSPVRKEGVYHIQRKQAYSRSGSSALRVEGSSERFFFCLLDPAQSPLSRKERTPGRKERAKGVSSFVTTSVDPEVTRLKEQFQCSSRTTKPT